MSASEMQENDKSSISKHKPSSNIEASGFFTTTEGKVIEIRDVWASNLDEEMEIIRDLIEKYPYVAMVRFPTRHEDLVLFFDSGF